MSRGPDPRTHRGRVGRDAETVARRWLEERGWTILATNVVIGRDEIDLIALDEQGDTLVFVEVRGHSSGRFGAAAESIDSRKLARLYRSAVSLVLSGWPQRHGLSGAVAWRVDVIAVEFAPHLARESGGPSVLHIRGVTLD
jgi:putative endonuclease